MANLIGVKATGVGNNQSNESFTIFTKIFKTSQAAQSRRDIQGLRTVAIVAVFVFHLWPKLFRNGFLGVDMFFTISGYLMAQILCKNDRISLQKTTKFYERRIRRIVPIFLIVICFTAVAGCFLLTNDDFEVLCEDTVPALMFTTNVRTLLAKDDYWAQVFTYRILLHTWSLGVEIQFYLLVPLIFYFLLKLKNRHHQCLASTAIAFASLALQFFSTQTVAFNLVFARMWQFFAGILAFFFTAINCESQTRQEDIRCNEEERATIKQKIFSSVCLCVLISMLFMTSSPIVHILKQLLVVASTACILGLGSPKINVRMFVLENWFFVKLGDWSYVWYLVHWPIIEFWLYWSPDGVMHAKDGVIITGLTVFFTLIFDLLDQRMRQISKFPHVVLLMCFLYALCAAFIFHGQRYGMPLDNTPALKTDVNYTKWFIEKLNDKNRVMRRKMLKDITLESKIAMNKILANASSPFGQCSSNETIMPFSADFKGMQCVYKGTGKMRAVLAGNSHAVLAFRSFARAFERHFDTLQLVWAPACLPIDWYTRMRSAKKCRWFVDLTLKTIEREKPEIVFLHYMWFGEMERPIREPANNDSIVTALNDAIARFQKHAKIIYIGEPHLDFKYPVSAELAKRLKQGMPLDVLNTKLSDHHKMWKHSFERLRLIKCAKCVFIPWTEAFCDSTKDVCRSFDEDSQLAYFYDQHHWSLHGRLKALPLLNRLSNELKN